MFYFIHNLMHSLINLFPAFPEKTKQLKTWNKQIKVEDVYQCFPLAKGYSTSEDSVK